MQTCYLAVDIGASSGRHIIGTVEHGVMALHEVYRFENRLIEKNGHLCWDMEGLVQNVIEGLKAAHDAGYTPTTVGIDTWAVDFLLLDADGTPIGDPVAYRDGRTAAMREELEPILPFTKLYARTGIQYQSFNTVYQLCALKKEHPEQLAAAEHFLMVPDYLNYRLTGVMANEYTNASTTALVGAISKDWDDEIINRLGLPRKIFGRISTPGTKLGNLSSAVKGYVGFDCTVVLPATHDTGSAFLAVPARDDKAVYLSSGTWSLLGTELDAPILTADSCQSGLSNELGANGKINYLKNIIGLWLIQESRREYKRRGQAYSFAELEQQALAAEPLRSFIDPDAPEFVAPGDLPSRIQEFCRKTGQPVPETVGAVMRCIYESLALKYRYAIEQLSAVTGRAFTTLHVLGGGTKDRLLCQMTADCCGLTVKAGPVEATALGNIMIQLKALGLLDSITQGRRLIAETEVIKTYTPSTQNYAEWNAAYDRFEPLL